MGLLAALWLGCLGLVITKLRRTSFELEDRVTERTSALRDSEERHRKIFDEGPLGMAIVGKDGRFFKVNTIYMN